MFSKCFNKNIWETWSMFFKCSFPGIADPRAHSPLWQRGFAGNAISDRFHSACQGIMHGSEYRLQNPTSMRIHAGLLLPALQLSHIPLSISPLLVNISSLLSPLVPWVPRQPPTIQGPCLHRLSDLSHVLPLPSRPISPLQSPISRQTSHSPLPQGQSREAPSVYIKWLGDISPLVRSGASIPM